MEILSAELRAKLPACSLHASLSVFWGLVFVSSHTLSLSPLQALAMLSATFLHHPHRKTWVFLVEGALKTNVTCHRCMEKYMPVLRVQWGKNPIFPLRQRKQGSEVEILPHGFSVCGFYVFLPFSMLAAFRVFGVSAWQCLSLKPKQHSNVWIESAQCPVLAG